MYTNTAHIPLNTYSKIFSSVLVTSSVQLYIHLYSTVHLHFTVQNRFLTNILPRTRLTHLRLLSVVPPDQVHPQSRVVLQTYLDQGEVVVGVLWPA